MPETSSGACAKVPTDRNYPIPKPQGRSLNIPEACRFVGIVNGKANSSNVFQGLFGKREKERKRKREKGLSAGEARAE